MSSIKYDFKVALIEETWRLSCTHLSTSVMSVGDFFGLLNGTIQQAE